MSKNAWLSFKEKNEEYQKEFIQNKLNEGVSKTALGEILGTSRNSITRLIKKLGIEEEAPTPSKKSQKDSEGLELLQKVNTLEEQFKQLRSQFEAIQKGIGTTEVKQHKSKRFKVRAYEKKGAIQSTIRLNPVIHEKLEKFYQEHEAMNKGDLLNSLLDWALDEVK